MKVPQKELLEEKFEKNLVGAITDVDIVRDDIIQGKKWRPKSSEDLSQASVKLSALNSYIGEFVAEAEFLASELKGTYKWEYEHAKLGYIKQKMTVAEAEARALEDTQPHLDRYNTAVYAHKLLQLKRSDTKDLVEAITRRLSFVKTERRQMIN